MTKYLVETISMFRMRYVIETDCAEYANDVIVTNDGSVEEMSQKHLDEIIVSTREITDEEYYKIFDEDNDYLTNWSQEQKLRRVYKI